jgi:hypothetical protein
MLSNKKGLPFCGKPSGIDISNRQYTELPLIIGK